MPFDADRFRKLYPRRPYPDVRFLSERARYAAGRRLAEHLGRAVQEGEDDEGGDERGNADDGDMGLPWGGFDRAAPVAGADVGTGDGAGPGLGLDLSGVLAACDLPAPGPLVHVEWYTGDGIEVPSADLAGFFPAFWQEGQDDLAVFDASCDWILYITRAGQVRLLHAGWAGER